MRWNHLPDRMEPSRGTKKCDRSTTWNEKNRWIHLVERFFPDGTTRWFHFSKSGSTGWNHEKTRSWCFVRCALFRPTATAVPYVPGVGRWEPAVGINFSSKCRAFLFQRPALHPSHSSAVVAEPSHHPPRKWRNTNDKSSWARALTALFSRVRFLP